MIDRPRPRLAFLGLGWIGRHRLQAIVECGAAEVVALADPDPKALEAAAQIAPGARRATNPQDVADLDADGVVIATPNAQHAPQAIAALRVGRAVFCQKPLARTVAETAQMVDTARRADRLLGVDFSYRHTEALRRVHDLVRDGSLGEVFAVDLVFHNAYGPDKAWFKDPASAGGGCLMDLGIHLVDFLHWTFPDAVERTATRAFAGGRLLQLPAPDAVEDFATADIQLAGGTGVRLACSWWLAAGCDARIEVTAYGTKGGAALRNVNGSFYDFVGEHYVGTRVTRISTPPDAWGGRAAVAWVTQLAERGPGFDPAIETAVAVAKTLDRLYGR